MTQHHGNTLRITFAYILRCIPKKTSFFLAKADVLPDKITLVITLQGATDPSDALSCRSFLAKEPLIVGLFCGK